MRLRLKAYALCVACAASCVAAGGLPDNAGDLAVQHLLGLAQSALASGDTQSALKIYDHCLEREPNDVATAYKRATVRLALGHWSKARDGFQDVIRLRNDWDQAHLQLAKVDAKLGQLDEALQAADTFFKLTDSKTGTDYSDLQKLKSDIVLARADMQKAQKAAAARQWQQCIASTTSVLQLSPNSENARLLRGDCYLHAHEFDSTIGDLMRASALTATLPPHLSLRIALLDAFFVDHGLALPLDTVLAPIKRCLASDPDSKSCRKLFKSLKALEKQVAQARNWSDGGRWNEAAVALAGGSSSSGVIDAVKSLIQDNLKPGKGLTEAPLPLEDDLTESSPLLRAAMSTLCRAYVMLGRQRKAEAVCEKVLRINENDIWALTSRGDGFMAQESYEDAVRMYTKAFENSGRSDRDILARLQKAQRLLKQSNQKDYYKILGVSRDADDKTIKRAYRKGTLKAHPDKPGGSEQKMAALNEAYEVLSNPEQRARFDNGEDPNDPASNQQHPFFQGAGGHPFAQFFQGGFPGHGGHGHGGQQFQFTWG
ncbi:hypothetical protein OIV83_000330 [Microbotryomycetes sp. JL201]|nr:hypothetical protein OIV83_000330 [Microbotryomycetes sp. JL201]